MSPWVAFLAGVLAAFAFSLIFSLILIGVVAREERKQQPVSDPAEDAARLEETLYWIGSAMQAQKRVPRVLVHRARGLIERVSTN